MTKTRVLSLLGWIAGFASLALFWNQLFNPKSGQNIGQTLHDLDWRLVLLSFTLFAVGHALYPLLPYLAHKMLKYPLNLSQSYQYWFSSQLAKYLPGGIWVVPARATFYYRNGMPPLLAGTLVLWEVLSILAANLIYGLLIPNATSIDALRVVPVASLGLMVLLGISQMLWPWKLLQRLGLHSAEKTHDAFVTLGVRRFWLLIVLTIASLAIWLVIGTGFYVLLLAFDKNIPVSWWSAVTIYGVSWAVGFLVFLTPAGLGPREATAALLLLPALGPSLAFSAALLARLAWTFGESIHIAAAALLQIKNARVKPDQVVQIQD